MKTTKKLALILVVYILFLGIAYPVQAGVDTYNCDEPTVTYGEWDVEDHDANEDWFIESYRCKFEFVYIEIRTDGYEYSIGLDYDGCTPWIFWTYESLKMEYKWGSGSWKTACYLDYLTYHGNLVIDDATSSTLYLRFTDMKTTSFDQMCHYWFFGDTPNVECKY